MAYACNQYEARLEDFLSGVKAAAADEELAAHVERCAGCRESLAAARLARDLLRAGLEPAPEPSGAFATRVIASIRAEQGRRQQFWQPLEVLASRLALTAAAVLLVLTVYLFEFTPPRDRQPMSSNQSQVGEGFLEPARQPTDKDEILLTLAENGHER